MYIILSKEEYMLSDKGMQHISRECERSRSIVAIRVTCSIFLYNGYVSDFFTVLYYVVV